ncbi:MAG: aminotransferase class V-fold PLP-dependent enzyme, partial [Nocardiopsaceae bacterium]|nr:aminotransferase class V-fold PLP-dependent enzyme [Nocardiopsaceae bacterium]
GWRGTPRVNWADAPARHEGGTPNVTGTVALAAACRAIERLGAGAVAAHEEELRDRLRAGLGSVAGVRVLRLWPDDDAERIGVASFVVPDCPAGLVAQYLSAEHGIGVRDGKFCAHPLVSRLAPSPGPSGGSAVRASLGLGSSIADVDRLVAALDALRSSGPAWSYADADAGYRPLPDPRPLPAWLLSARCPLGLTRVLPAWPHAGESAVATPTAVATALRYA